MREGCSAAISRLTAWRWPPESRPMRDLLVIHDTGAYGASMSSNYNTRPLVAEVLVDGAEHRLIRRRQTVEELLSLELGL